MNSQPKGDRLGGRAKGTLNKATKDIKEICRGHGPSVIEALVRLASEADSDAAKIGAIKEILDRGYGKARQPHDGDGEGGPINHKIAVEFVRAKLLEGPVS